jgi:hypothetical protein
LSNSLSKNLCGKLKHTKPFNKNVESLWFCWERWACAYVCCLWSVHVVLYTHCMKHCKHTLTNNSNYYTTDYLIHDIYLCTQVTLFLPLHVREYSPEIWFMDLPQCSTVLSYLKHHAHCKKQNLQSESLDTISKVIW